MTSCGASRMLARKPATASKTRLSSASRRTPKRPVHHAFVAAESLATRLEHRAVVGASDAVEAAAVEGAGGVVGENGINRDQITVGAHQVRLAVHRQWRDEVENGRPVSRDRARHPPRAGNRLTPSGGGSQPPREGGERCLE